ncbi:DCL family protein [Pseudomonas lurida]|uniref:DCL family protein n=1 Tax=Pseudomonas lurida TaxID=244566 RepID=UPI00177CF4E8|nr:DCL family protein [Pseudomonas lurida]MBD8666340.1 DCL family protein [Pseudomonas lurida]UZQ74822.1 DCL family protein [Pseudomonas lurida]WLG31190.1 DCL family protein [Pseudomonas lurida]
MKTATAGVVTNKHAIKRLHLLIAMHPDAERKIGVGVDHFKIKRNALGAGNSFWLVRSDGSEDSFSYERCITGVPQSPHEKVCEALRFVVRPQMQAFRDALGLPVKCSETGKNIIHRKDLHIDHKATFCNLLERFCQDQKVDLLTLETIGNGETLELLDKEIASAFKEFSPAPC